MDHIPVSRCLTLSMWWSSVKLSFAGPILDHRSDTFFVPLQFSELLVLSQRKKSGRDVEVAMSR